MVEFALVALALYLLLAGILGLGRWLATAQVAQDVVRFAAREVALYPLPAQAGFLDALADSGFRTAVYDPDQLVVDLAATPPGPALDALFAGLPVVNRALRPLMITSDVDTPAGRRRLLHMPGALVDSALSPSGLTVVVPRVRARDGSTGVETDIDLLPVLEEIAPGAFAVSGAGGGLVGLRLNVPYQSAALAAYLPAGALAPPGRPILAQDPAGTNTIVGPGPGGAGPYSGTLGLGRLEALGVSARPFRRLIAAQALFRRELTL